MLAVSDCCLEGLFIGRLVEHCLEDVLVQKVSFGLLDDVVNCLFIERDRRGIVKTTNTKSNTDRRMLGVKDSVVVTAVDVEQPNWCRRFGGSDLEDVQRTKRLIWWLWLENLHWAAVNLSHCLDLNVSSVAPVFSHRMEVVVEVLPNDKVLDMFLVVFLLHKERNETEGSLMGLQAERMFKCSLRVLGTQKVSV